MTHSREQTHRRACGRVSKQNTHGQEECITAMENREMQQARLMLGQDWKQGPTQVCLKNCWGLLALNNCYKAISRSCCTLAEGSGLLGTDYRVCLEICLRRRLRDEQCVQRGSFYWNTVREMSERYRLTLSAVRWNTPRDALEWALPGREGGSRIPTLCRKREGEKYNKKREQGKTRHQKATPFFFPKKGIIVFPVVLLGKCYTLSKPRCPKLVRNLTKYLHFCPIFKYTFLSKIVLGEQYRNWAFYD